MPPVVIPNTARAAIRMQVGGRQRVNVLHFNKAGGFSTSDLNTLNTELMTWWQTFMRPQLSTLISLVDITSTNLHDAVQEQDVQPCLSNCAGQNAGEPEPGNVTFTTSWRTDVVGRRYRGRSYWPGMVNTNTNNDDTVVSTLLTAAAVAAGNLIFGSISNGAALAIASRVLLSSRVVTGFVLENILDSQRRRLPGRGT
jgi:hypothetical protein